MELQNQLIKNAKYDMAIKDLKSDQLKTVDFIKKYFDFELSQDQIVTLEKLDEKFPLPVAKTLVHFSMAINHKQISIPFIEKTSSDWERKGVKTYEHAISLSNELYALHRKEIDQEYAQHELTKDIFKNVKIMHSIGCSVEEIGAYVLKRMDLPFKPQS